MKLKHKVVDNFLPENEFKKIEEMFFSPYFSWYGQHNGVSKNVSKDGIYFTHLFFLFEKNEFKFSDYYNYIIPIINKLDIKSLIRIKGNLYSKTNVIFEHNAHIDYNFEHKGFIYYVNDNNGFTKLSDGTKINSKKNRGLFFDASKPHNSSTCSNTNVRLNINFNYF
jgi:hypothetical protein